MNKEIRELLIQRAVNGKVVYYGEVMDRLGLKRGVSEDHQELSKVLADISRFEYDNKRPLLSSIATYSPETTRLKNGETHGNGFYELAETLNKHKGTVLKAGDFAITEMAKCMAYWKDQKHYNDFFVVQPVMDNNIVSPPAPEFYKQEDISFLEQWGGKVYDKDNAEHVAAKNRIINSVGTNAVYWSQQLVKQVKGFEAFNWRMWSQKGWEDTEDGKKRVAKFKHYSWARIYKMGDAYKDIFFTIESNGMHKSLVYKLDYYFEKNSKLSASQKELCKQLIPDEVSWIEIPFEEIPDYNWEKLIELTANFIKTNEGLYEEIVSSVWNDEVRVSKLKDRLIKRDVPETGVDEIPKRTFLFNGVEIDWEEQNKDFSEIGKIGEELVIEYEKRMLRNAGKYAYVDDVAKVKDGEGYDIFSRNLDGTAKKIEVKTTTRNADTPFPISLNEIAFSEVHSVNYSLYHVYNLNRVSKVAEFHEYVGNLKDHFLFESMRFNAFRKSRK